MTTHEAHVDGCSAKENDLSLTHLLGLVFWERGPQLVAQVGVGHDASSVAQDLETLGKEAVEEQARAS